jgi:hypothetical protein
MRYDFERAKAICAKFGFPVTEIEQALEIVLSESAVLCIQNAPDDVDCLVGFKNMPWHTHDQLMFCDSKGNYVEMDYLDALVGLGNGQVLICARKVSGTIEDQWLIHHNLNDEFSHLIPGEEVVVCRANSAGGT